ncbi:MAG TPA: hypothetical protein ENI95_00485, partial [Chloroflexi bacterium]|nr:hypothetical protein [Chloroflexota bacterium]
MGNEKGTGRSVRDTGRRLCAILVLVVAIAVLFTPVTLVAFATQGDFRVHMGIAWTWRETGHLTWPHFLYHLLTILLSYLMPGGSLNIAGFTISMLAYVALGMVIYDAVCGAVASRRGKCVSVLSLIITLSLMLVSPVNLFTLPIRNLYLGYISPTVYHNPTLILLKPVALLLFFSGLRVFDNS